MNRKPGFFLIETLVYLCAFSMLVILMLRSSIGFIHQLTQLRAQLQRTSSIQSILQRFARDVEQAPAERHAWLESATDAVMWKTKNDYRAWCFEKGILVRRQGSFNAEKKSWGKKTKSLAAAHLKSVSFAVENDEESVYGVKVTIEAFLHNSNKTSCFALYVPLRNRKLVP